MNHSIFLYLLSWFISFWSFRWFADDSKFRITIETLMKSTGIRAAVTGFEGLVDRLKRVAAAGRNAFSVISRGINTALIPLKVFTATLAGGGGILAAFAASSLKAAGTMEMLRTQLQAVLATKKDADKAFAESIKFSVKTPFTPEEIIATRVALEGVGVQGKDAVESVASTAAALNRNILDVASAVKSLETEPLRNLGIMLKKDGDTFIFDYKNRMQEARQITATGFAEAQQSLLSIMIEKFDGGLEAMSQTMQGKLSTLKGAFDQWRADFGSAIMPVFKRILDDLINFFNGNTLASWGTRLNEILDVAYTRLQAAFLTARDAAVAIRDHLKNGGDGLGQMITSALSNVGQTIVDALVAAVQASLAVWKLVGNIIGGAILEQLLQIDSVITNKMRESMLGKMSGSEIEQYFADQGMVMPKATTREFDFKPNRMGMGRVEQRELTPQEIAKEYLSPEKQAEMISGVRGQKIEGAISGFKGDVSGAGSSFTSKMMENMQSFFGVFNKISGSGFDPAAVNQQYVQQIEDRRNAPAGGLSASEGKTQVYDGSSPAVMSQKDRERAKRTLYGAYQENESQISQGENDVWNAQSGLNAAERRYGSDPSSEQGQSAVGEARDTLKSAQDRLARDKQEAEQIKQLAQQFVQAGNANNAELLVTFQALVAAQAEQSAAIAEMRSQIANTRS